MKLNTNLWLENARDQRALQQARSNERQRRLFPWLLVAALGAVTFLYLWLTT